ncbi:MAG: MBL fold metallo-hydrolase [Acidobacteriota bacterium]|jgi:phosphoribosyl 1,2-cyclic phosphodiesterase|nr:MBL fold metallo-hydrolase [Acidobacteriota bacterium]
MGLCFNVLGSGSSGNATLVSDGDTHILVDAGLSGLQLGKRLRDCGVAPEKIAAIVISHNHGDHCGGVSQFVKKLDIPVYMAPAAFENFFRTDPVKSEDDKRPYVPSAKHRAISPGETFAVGGIAVTSFSVPHDATDPLGFVLEKDGVKIGVALDLGFMSNLVIERLKGCAGLVLESNHDVRMLQAGPYPWELKQRVMSRSGHLSNDAVAKFLSCDFDGAAAHVVLAHLSRKNNMPEVALISAQTAIEERDGLGLCATRCELSYPDRISKTYRY